MKSYILLIFTLIFSSSTIAQKIADISDIQKPHQMKVDANDLYIFDEENYELYIYSISPFRLKQKIGKKVMDRMILNICPMFLCETNHFYTLTLPKRYGIQNQGK